MKVKGTPQGSPERPVTFELEPLGDSRGVELCSIKKWFEPRRIKSFRLGHRPHKCSEAVCSARLFLAVAAPQSAGDPSVPFVPHGQNATKNFRSCRLGIASTAAQKDAERCTLLHGERI
jgi:hypothetical protein